MLDNRSTGGGVMFDYNWFKQYKYINFKVGRRLKRYINWKGLLKLLQWYQNYMQFQFERFHGTDMTWESMGVNSTINGLGEWV